MIGEYLLHYRITEKVGAGGMGVVYKATDTRLGREVAVKVLSEALPRDQERLDRLRREARLLAQLNHPAIATLHGLEESGGQPFLVMELVPGETLAERIAREPVPVEQARDWFRQIAEGLHAAHERGIIHRDLKPANIKITPEGQVKLLDFGLARVVDPSFAHGAVADSSTVTREAPGTRTGVICGTALYMSPEQARGQALDRRTDIWSFGCCLYETLAGRTAFPGRTVSDVIAQVLEREPEWAEVDAPPRVVEVLRRCLQKEKPLRFHDVADVRLALDDAFAWQPDEPRTDAGTREHTLGWLVAVLTVALLATAVLSGRRGDRATQVVRALVAPPTGGTFFLEVEGPAPVVVSPDGTQIAFGATDENGVRRLWVRRLDDLSPRALPGTEDARYPFWSSDSRTLGFFTLLELKRVDSRGGRPRALTGVRNGKGGTWNGDGVIVFGAVAGPLYRVDAEGGPVDPVTTLDAEGGEVSHRYPRFLPDGRHFLFVARAPAPGSAPNRLLLGSLDGGATKEVTKADSQAEVAGGHLWLVRGGTLVAFPFDAARAEVTGPPVPMAEKVAQAGDGGVGLFSVSPSGALAYQTDWAPERTSLVWYDREGRPGGALGPPAVHISVALSPDGTSAAFVRTDETGNEDVWVHDLSHGIATRLTFDRGGDIEPIWSPDGARIAFTKGEGTTYVQSVSGAADAVRLGSDSRPLITGDWAPDGRHIVGFSFEEGQSDLWVLPLEGGGSPSSLQQTPFREWQPDISPDGRWVAYSSDESGRQEVYVTRFPEGGRKWQLSSQGGSFGEWNGAGDELFYLDDSNALVAVPVTVDDGRIVAGRAQPLFQTRARYGWTDPLAVSADGQRFLINTLEAPAAPSPITLVVGWPSELEHQKRDAS